MKKYIVELIGTFFLVLAIILSVNGTSEKFAPIAVGFILIVLVYAGKHISGAHYNPAVTLAIWLRGKCPTKDIPGYLTAQLLGAGIASFIGIHLLNNMPGAVGINTMQKLSFIPSIVSEFLGTFLLCFVYFNVTVAKRNDGNPYYGIAIGLTVTGCMYILGDISGSVLNPALALSLVGTKMSVGYNLLPFFAGQILGAVTATTIFGFVNGPE